MTDSANQRTWNDNGEWRAAVADEIQPNQGVDMEYDSQAHWSDGWHVNEDMEDDRAHWSRLGLAGTEEDRSRGWGWQDGDHAWTGSHWVHYPSVPSVPLAIPPPVVAQLTAEAHPQSPSIAEPHPQSPSLQIPAGSSQSAVAARDEYYGLTFYDLAFFVRRRSLLSRHYKQHNYAMTWLREQCEAANATGLCLPAPKNTSAYIPYMTLHIDEQATEHSWNDSSVPWGWYWADMVAQLDNDSMRQLVLGDGRSDGGLTRCIFFQHDAYDHTRGHISTPKGRQPTGGRQPREWSFICVRDDDSYGSLVPHWSVPTVGFTDGPPGSARQLYGALSGSYDAPAPGLCHGINGQLSWGDYRQTHAAQHWMRFDENLKWDHGSSD